MADTTDLPDMRKRFERVRAQTRGGGGHGPTGDDEVERRIKTLETSIGKLDRKLDSIIDTQIAERLSNEKRFGSIDARLSAIDEKLDAKASAADVARITGRVDSLPTTWQMITLVVGTVSRSSAARS